MNIRSVSPNRALVAASIICVGIAGVLAPSLPFHLSGLDWVLLNPRLGTFLVITGVFLFLPKLVKKAPNIKEG